MTARQRIAPSWRVILVLALAFFAALAGIDLVIMNSQRQSVMQAEQTRAQGIIGLAAAVVTDSMLRFRLDEVEQFILLLGQQDNDICAITARSPEGQLVAQYRRPDGCAQSIAVETPVTFNGRPLLNLRLAVDTDDEEQLLQSLNRQLLIQSGGVTVVIAIIIWVILEFLAIRPLEREILQRQRAEAELHRLNERLERLVQERTTDLARKNEELERQIQEKERAQEELLRAKKLESVGVLAGGIAHDFNNILAAVLGNVSLAALHTPPDAKAHRLLKDAEKAIMRATGLTQQLLTFAKGGEPVKENASLERLIRDSADFILRGSNIACHYTFAPDLWPAEVDTGQMSQVIQNLVLNARQAMPSGGVIAVRGENVSLDPGEGGPALPPGDYVKIVVQDKGGGIPAEHLDRIFDPYFSTKKDGSGLGLAVCHSIVRKHNGAIQVESTAGQGTAFTIFLPANRRGAAASPTQEEVTPGSGTVMIMDDEEMIREACRQMLAHLGYSTICAADGKEAIELYRQHLASGQRIDAVIMDLTIPGGMGGLEAAAAILALDAKARLIVASGYSNDPVIARFREYGFVGSMIKPFSLSILSDTLHRVLRKRD